MVRRHKRDRSIDAAAGSAAKQEEEVAPKEPKKQKKQKKQKKSRREDEEHELQAPVFRPCTDNPVADEEEDQEYDKDGDWDEWLEGEEGEEGDSQDEEDGGGGEEDEGLHAGLSERDEMPIDFGFYDPMESDYHGMRALLSGGASVLPAGASWDVSGLANALCEQPEVGSVAKVVGDGTEEAADGEVLGFLSAVGLRRWRSAAFAKQFGESALKRCASSADSARVSKVLADAGAALIISERLLNLPAALVPSLVESLMRDIHWAANEDDDVESRRRFQWTKLLLLARVGVPAAAQGGEAGSSSAHAAAPPGASGGKEGKKKKKKAAAWGGGAELELIDSLEFERMEEQVLAHAAEWSVLLNGTGRDRQLLLCLEPDAIREAIPAMHAAMGE